MNQLIYKKVLVKIREKVFKIIPKSLLGYKSTKKLCCVYLLNKYFFSEYQKKISLSKFGFVFPFFKKRICYFLYVCFMEFRTIVPCKKLQYPISHQSGIVLLGSCFAENIGHLLDVYKFNVEINPTGILYNPFSIADALHMLMDGVHCTEKDIFKAGNLWHSFRHHSRFSHTDANLCLEGINSRLDIASRKLSEASWLLITFGTAYVYTLRETGQIVANCHKLPASLFDRRRVGVGELLQEWMPLTERLFKSNPALRILFTVSPIRHLKDGAHENQLSKSVLLLFVDELCRLFPENCFYFPSYEIVMDELRDYRFYDAGMTHPTEQAIDYIWERFSESCFSEETRMLNREWAQLEKALHHRPLTPDAEAFRTFSMQNLFKLKKIREKYPYFDLSEEINSLESFLKTL